MKEPKSLANATADINLINSEEDAALHIAMRSSAQPVIKILLENGSLIFGKRILKAEMFFI
ncbi:MAG: hypothetical protein MRQ09_00355 [Candidatus Midichloria sp.]|nr:hypothetical protein [Candidatus Midichloria sp.]